MQYTFSRNLSIAALRAGKYSNIRMTQARTIDSTTPLYLVNSTAWGNDRQPSGAPSFLWATAHTLATTNFSTKHNGCCGYDWAYNQTVLEQFSATCYYFAQELTDLIGDHVPIGLISSSVGGTIIESWTDNATLDTCQKAGRSISSGSQQLYNGMVLPYVNMSIKGFLWCESSYPLPHYCIAHCFCDVVCPFCCPSTSHTDMCCCADQGENNVGEGPLINPPKNSPAGTLPTVIPTPYECMMPKMIASWRKIWSATPNTTDPNAPFGLVGLAAGTSEGHNYNMPYFRSAQTAGFGVLPNPVMPSVVIANGYDIGDPWQDNCGSRMANQSACCRATWFDAIDPKRCNMNASEAGQIWNWDATNYFMGPIHPRAKIWVGKRLAAAIYNLVYGGTGPIVGPVISSCKMSVDGKAVTVQFNSSLLLGDTVSLGLYNETAIASAMEVQIAKGPNANDGTVPNLIGSSSLSPPPPPMDGTWIPAQIRAAGAPNAITIDVSALKDNGTTPLGIRYAWSDTPCCDGYYGFGAGDAPCPMASCPIKGSKSQLPAMPFIASLVEGTCVCTPPQVC